MLFVFSLKTEKELEYLVINIIGRQTRFSKWFEVSDQELGVRMMGGIFIVGTFRFNVFLNQFSDLTETIFGLFGD